MSYLTVPIQIVTVKNAIMEYRLLGPSETPPTPADGYAIEPDPVEIEFVQGKFWVEFKIVES